MNLINELRTIRQSQKISIKRLAEKSGVNKQTIETWEYLGVIPSLDKFEQVADALGCELKIARKGDSK